MRIFGYRMENFIKTLLALVLAIGVLFFMWAMQGSRFSDVGGERVFYLKSASSQGLRTEKWTLRDLPYIRGESVCVDFDKDMPVMLTERDAHDWAEKILQKYNAKLLFTENVAGIISYYAYTPRYFDGIMLNGVKINLHIAVCLETKTCVMGSPIIFDGY